MARVCIGITVGRSVRYRGHDGEHETVRIAQCSAAANGWALHQDEAARPMRAGVRESGRGRHHPKRDQLQRRIRRMRAGR